MANEKRTTVKFFDITAQALGKRDYGQHGRAHLGNDVGCLLKILAFLKHPKAENGQYMEEGNLKGLLFHSFFMCPSP